MLQSILSKIIMVRKYIWKVGSTRRQQYSNANSAKRRFGIPCSTTQDHLKKLDNQNELSKIGTKTALTATKEKVLSDVLTTCANWGYPFKMREVCQMVKEYLDSINKNVPQFNDNKPGSDWARSFLSRHPNLKSRSAENIKHSRANLYLLKRFRTISTN